MEPKVLSLPRQFRIKARLGLAPPSAEKGDIICVLFGCSVPVLLRPSTTKGREDEFTFIGECYLHGMMDGEAISGFTKRGLARKQMVFKLR